MSAIRSMYSRVVATFAIILIGVGSAGWANAQTTGPQQAPKLGEFDPNNAFGPLEKSLKQLEDSMKDAKGKIPKLSQEIGEAEAMIDSLIARLKAAAAEGREDSEFVKQIDQLTQQARQEARAARDARKPDIASSFDDFANRLEGARKRALGYSNDSFKIIRELEDRKQDVAWLYKLGKFAEATKIINEGVDRMGDLTEDLKRLRTSLPGKPGS